MHDLEKLILTDEYAQIRRCSPRTIEREREHGDGCPYIRIGRRIYYRRADIEEFIMAHVRGASHRPPMITHVEPSAPPVKRERTKTAGSRTARGSALYAPEDAA